MPMASRCGQCSSRPAALSALRPARAVRVGWCRILLPDHLRQPVELLPERGSLPVALGFVAEAPEEQGRVMSELAHDFPHAFGLPRTVFGTVVAEPLGGFEPDPETDRQSASLRLGESGRTPLFAPGADGIASALRHLGVALVGSGPFDKEWLPLADQPALRVQPHRVRFRGRQSDGATVPDREAVEPRAWQPVAPAARSATVGGAGPVAPRRDPCVRGPVPIIRAGPDNADPRSDEVHAVEPLVQWRRLAQRAGGGRRHQDRTRTTTAAEAARRPAAEAAEAPGRTAAELAHHFGAGRVQVVVGLELGFVENLRELFALGRVAGLHPRPHLLDILRRRLGLHIVGQGLLAEHVEDRVLLLLRHFQVLVHVAHPLVGLGLGAVLAFVLLHQIELLLLLGREFGSDLRRRHAVRSHHLVHQRKIRWLARLEAVTHRLARVAGFLECSGGHLLLLRTEIEPGLQEVHLGGVARVRFLLAQRLAGLVELRTPRFFLIAQLRATRGGPVGGGHLLRRPGRPRPPGASAAEPVE